MGKNVHSWLIRHHHPVQFWQWGGERIVPVRLLVITKEDF